MDEIWICECGVSHHVNTRLKGEYACGYDCGRVYGAEAGDAKLPVDPEMAGASVAPTVNASNELAHDQAEPAVEDHSNG